MSGSNSSVPSANDRSDPLLQMSVHSLPLAQAGLQQRTRMGRIKMFLVWAVCAAPVIASYLTYYVVRPEGRANYGQLVSPAVPMPADAALSLHDASGKSVALSSLKGQWLLVTVAGGACDAVCEKNLYLQRQLRETLGRDKDRMDRVWLVNDDQPVREALTPGLQGAWVLRANPQALSRWLQPETGQGVAAHLYMVDPNGAWMMRFPASLDANQAKRDLSRLMKASGSWDEAGR